MTQYNVDELHSQDRRDLTPIEILSLQTNNQNSSIEEQSQSSKKEEEIRKHLSHFGIKNEIAKTAVGK